MSKPSCEIFPPILEKDEDGNVIIPDDPKTNTSILERTKPKLRPPYMYHVVLLNDDFTPMEFVVMILQRVFNKPAHEAEALMMEVHKKGKAIAGTYTFEVAEMKALETVQRAKASEHPLQAILERAE